MKEIETTPAAELVGEYEELAYKYQNWDGDSIPEPTQRDSNRVDEIAQELDRRCAEMRISLWNGLFKSDNPETAGVDFDEDGEFEGIAHVFITTKPASELHALLGWLIMKEGQRV